MKNWKQVSFVACNIFLLFAAPASAAERGEFDKANTADLKKQAVLGQGAAAAGAGGALLLLDSSKKDNAVIRGQIDQAKAALGKLEPEEQELVRQKAGLTQMFLSRSRISKEDYDKRMAYVEQLEKANEADMKLGRQMVASGEKGPVPGVYFWAKEEREALAKEAQKGFKPSVSEFDAKAEVINKKLTPVEVATRRHRANIESLEESLASLRKAKLRGAAAYSALGVGGLVYEINALLNLLGSPDKPDAIDSAVASQRGISKREERAGGTEAIPGVPAGESQKVGRAD